MHSKKPEGHKRHQQMLEADATLFPFSEYTTVCTDCKMPITIRVSEVLRDYEELMATVLCQACLYVRVQRIAAARHGRIERRGRPRKQ